MSNLISKLKCVFALPIVLFSCAPKSDAAGTEAVIARRLTAANPNVRACWVQQGALSNSTRAAIESKTLEQFNNRTPVKFTFSDGKCDASGKQSTYVNIYVNPTFNNFCYDTSGTKGGLTANAGVLAQPNGVDRDMFVCYDTMRRGYGDPASSQEAQAAFVFTFLHEFAHVVGLDHEHEREEMTAAHPACAQRLTRHLENWRQVYAQKRRGDFTPHGPYDPNSISNYCATRARELSGIKLSEGDVAALNQLYSSSPNETAGQNSSSQDPEPPNATQDGQNKNDKGDQPASGDGQTTSSPPNNESPSGNKDSFVYCDLNLLQSCVVKYLGGAGCLNTSRSRGECRSSPSAGRKKIDLNKVTACMHSKSEAQKKFSCVSADG